MLSKKNSKFQSIEMEENMKKIIMKFGNVMAMLALVAATLNVNSTCSHHIYQETVPESAKKLSKVK